jgi:hypothetical protein
MSSTISLGCTDKGSLCSQASEVHYNVRLSKLTLGLLLIILKQESRKALRYSWAVAALAMKASSFSLQSSDVKPEMKIVKEEIFGPVVAITKFKDE